MEVLKGCAQSVFEWLQPALPEDLCLLRDNGAPLLTTIAHEKLALLELSASDRASLLRSGAGVGLSRFDCP